jgi:transposase
MEEKKTRLRGRPGKPLPESGMIIGIAYEFLRMFMPKTLCKRLVSVVLIAAGLSNFRIAELTGISDSSINRFKKALYAGNGESIFAVRHGGGRPGKAKGFEREIVEELEKNNYHTRQQIAQMIYEKFGVTMSVSAVGKLLKKTASGG